jgi:hypothetical protein
LNNKVVARYADGRMVKGSTSDFVPTKDVFHVAEVNAPLGTRPVTLLVKELKAVFFVKDFVGRKEHAMSLEFDPARPAQGKKIRVLFKDGEVVVGTTQGYTPGRPGFFMIPADTDGNIERCYVVADATKEIAFL